MTAGGLSLPGWGNQFRGEQVFQNDERRIFTTLIDRMRSRTLVLAAFLMLASRAVAQLVVDETLTPAQLVQNVLLGGGVTASNVVYNGVSNPAAAQLGSGSFTQTGDLGLEAGVILSSGFAASAIGPEADVFSSDVLDDNGDDPDLEALVDGPITDYSILEFDFIPTGDSLRFRYVFGSEEYPNWICSEFNDAFGFFLSGPGIAGPFTNGAINIALLSDEVTPVSINTVHEEDEFDPTGCPATNEEYYVNNTGGATISYGGFTTVLTAFALVQCGETYHIKLAIADAGGTSDFDTGFDSGVFLEAGSFTSSGQVVPQLVTGPGVIGNTMSEGCVPVELRFTRQGDLSMAENVDITVSGTATPGVDYFPALPTELAFAEEDSMVSFLLDIPLDADGPETLVITISQLIVCANTNVETVFNFNIDSPDPLVASTQNIAAVCGDVNVLDPQITGGVGYYAYQWSTGETTPTITVSPFETTTYSFTVTDSCSVEPITGSFTVTLPVYDPLAIEVSPPTAIPCLGSDQIAVLSATGGDGSYTYQWLRAGVNMGNGPSLTVPSGPDTWYHVTVSEGCGSSVEDSVLVSMVPMDPIEITTTDDVTVICRGDSTEMAISGIVGGNGVYTIAWTDPDGLVLAVDSDLTVAVSADVLYTITVDDQCGTTGTAQVQTRIPQYAQFQVYTNADHVICFGDSSLVNVSVLGGSGYYRIDWVDQGWTDPILKVIPLEETTYTVNVTDQCGEVLSDEVTVDVEAVYVAITTENLGQDDWHLRASTVPIALTHVWDMGDGTFYREEHVFHSYLDLEEHWVSLRITTTNGCTGIDSVLLKPPAHIYFPNAFTPDGDGVNEVFGPIGHYIDDFEMTIFDRWGEAIFTTTSMDRLWKGDVNGGDPATTGVYVYKYRAAGLYFPSTEGIGHVTLLNGTQE